jgi:hypothetical protein
MARHVFEPGAIRVELRTDLGGEMLQLIRVG